MDERWQRELDRMMTEAFSTRLFGTTSTANTEQPPLTLDGLLYHLAVIKQDFEENPVAVAVRAEPGTIAWLKYHLPTQTIGVNGAFSGMRIEEDPTLPPRRLDFVDHRGRVIKRVEIERR